MDYIVCMKSMKFYKRSLKKRRGYENGKISFGEVVESDATSFAKAHVL